MNRRFPRHAAHLILPALVCLLGHPAPLFGQDGAQDPFERSRRLYLLNWTFKKLQKDAERLAKFSRKLRDEVEKDSGQGMPERIEERARDLECKAEELNAAARAATLGQLSVTVVELASEIEEEGKRLREEFKSLPAGKRRDRFRTLANEIRKKAGSVKNKMRSP